MQSPFIPIPDTTALSRVLTAATQAPAVLFKHGPFCGLRLTAYRELGRMPGPISVVGVARQRALSASIADHTGVRHESPQVLLLRGGGTVWSASHSAITAAAVRRAPQEPAAAAR